MLVTCLVCSITKIQYSITKPYSAPTKWGQITKGGEKWEFGKAWITGSQTPQVCQLFVLDVRFGRAWLVVASWLWGGGCPVANGTWLPPVTTIQNTINLSGYELVQVSMVYAYLLCIVDGERLLNLPSINDTKHEIVLLSPIYTVHVCWLLLYLWLVHALLLLFPCFRVTIICKRGLLEFTVVIVHHLYLCWLYTVVMWECNLCVDPKDRSA